MCLEHLIWYTPSEWAFCGTSTCEEVKQYVVKQPLILTYVLNLYTSTIIMLLGRL